MQIFPKTKGFCNKRGLFRKKITLFNKNCIYILRKNSNPKYWVLERKNVFWKKKNRDPCLIVMVCYIHSLQVHYGKPGLQEVATFARCIFSSLTFPKKREKHQNVCILQAGQPSSHDGNFDRGRLPRYPQVEISFCL